MPICVQFLWLRQRPSENRLESDMADSPDFFSSEIGGDRFAGVDPFFLQTWGIDLLQGNGSETVSYRVEMFLIESNFMQF